VSALRLYKKHDKASLLALMDQVSKDPANRAPEGSLFIHTKAAGKKLDDIAQAITWHIGDEREAAGKPVSVDGYSGRQTNRR